MINKKVKKKMLDFTLRVIEQDKIQAAIRNLNLKSNGIYVSTIFSGASGFYYDAVGDEIFEATHINADSRGNIYRINFGDELKIGHIKDHGFNFFLGKL